MQRSHQEGSEGPPPDVYHVLPDDQLWVVRREGGGIVDRAYTKGIALASARAYAKRPLMARVIVHGEDGSIESEEVHAREPRSGGPGIGQKILVIEDDPAVRRTLSRMLQVNG